jgi:hypothetical protein
LPLNNEISRSLESPPSSTATLPKSAADPARRMTDVRVSRLMPALRRCALRCAAKCHASLAPRAARAGSRLHIGGACGAVIDDEIGVLVGHRGIADAKSLEARRFDQARRMISPADW